MTQHNTLPTTARRVLIVKFGAIGDVIMAIPAVRALYDQGAQIDWVCGQSVAPLLACYGWIRTMIIDDRALLTGGPMARLSALISIWRILGRRRYDVCATLYYDPRYGWPTRFVSAGRRLSLSSADRNLSLIAGRHHSDEFARILLGLEDSVRPVGLAPVRPDSIAASPLALTPGKTRVVLAPAGARNMLRDDALRRWPEENYFGLADHLLAKGCEVVLIGGSDDAWISPRFAGLDVTNLIGKLSLPETLSVLDKSDVLVTHDTGPLHLGGITRVGIVCIFGPTDPRGRIPRRKNVVALWGGEGFACRPCYDGRNFAPCTENGCMRQISVKMVIDQVEAMLRQGADEARPPRVVTPVSTVMEEWQ